MNRPPAPGTGRGQLVDRIQLRLGLLRGLSQFFERLTDAEGALVCPRHRVEHTGKVVYAAILNLHLWRYTREDDFLDRARRQVLRATDHLGMDPDSDVPVFLPGRVDPRNASTNAIDGGACADTIATLLEETPDVFSRSEHERCRDALESHVERYLRHAARDKGITAQRLWAGTGVVRAARLLDRADWRADALEGVRRALDELAPDGVAPYIPAHASECTHPGLSDTSTFYHSRTPAFALYIHEVAEEPLDASARERLAASLDALLAMRDGLGRKVLHNEAKPWYWESAYEVASHPFDIYALHVGARVLDRPVFANEAGRAMVEWAAHVDALDGGVRSHYGRGANFQCRIFWSAHGAWVARVIEDVSLDVASRDPLDVDCAHSGLLHVERPHYVAVLRGARRPASNLFGCSVGGGSLQSLVTRERPELAGAEQVPAERRGSREGSFALRPRGGASRWARLVDVWRRERSDLRFRLYIASVEWKAGAFLHALCYPWRHVVLASWRAASPWSCAHLDTATTQTFADGEVVFRGALAELDGTRAQGTRTERRYRFADDRVELEDVLRLDGVRGRVRYVLPRRLTDVEVVCDGGAVKRVGRRISVRATGGRLALTVRGSWRAR